MSQFIILKDNTILNTQTIMSLGSHPNEIIEIKFTKEETFQKLFSIYSKNSETFKEETISEFSIYSASGDEEPTLQGTHIGFCNLVSITFDNEVCTVKLEKLSDYDLTIKDIKETITTETSMTNDRVLELESIVFDLMMQSMQQ